jgi:hypothetical protein
MMDERTMNAFSSRLDRYKAGSPYLEVWLRTPQKGILDGISLLLSQHREDELLKCAWRWPELITAALIVGSLLCIALA